MTTTNNRGNSGAILINGDTVIKQYYNPISAFYEELSLLVCYNIPHKILSGNSIGKLVFPRYEHITFQLSVSDFSNLCLQVLSIHNRNMVHTDIRPDNIMKRGNEIILIDFDTCTREGFPVTATSYPSYRDYNGVVTKSSDVWMLGLIGYTILTSDNDVWQRLMSPSILNVTELQLKPFPIHDNFSQLINSMISPTEELRPNMKEVVLSLGLPSTHCEAKYPSIKSYVVHSVNVELYFSIIKKFTGANTSELLLASRLCFVLLSRGNSVDVALHTTLFAMTYYDRCSTLTKDYNRINISALVSIDFPSNPNWYPVGKVDDWYSIESLLSNNYAISPRVDVSVARCSPRVAIIVEHNGGILNLQVNNLELEMLFQLRDLVWRDPTILPFRIGDESLESALAKYQTYSSSQIFMINSPIASYQGRHIKVTDLSSYRFLKNITSYLSISISIYSVLHGTHIRQ